MMVDNFPDEHGVPLPDARMAAIRQAMAALVALTDFERAYIFCWFCKSCFRYVGPGDSCNCSRDE